MVLQSAPVMRRKKVDWSDSVFARCEYGWAYSDLILKLIEFKDKRPHWSRLNAGRPFGVTGEIHQAHRIDNPISNSPEALILGSCHSRYPSGDEGKIIIKKRSGNWDFLQYIKPPVVPQKADKEVIVEYTKGIQRLLNMMEE